MKKSHTPFLKITQNFRYAGDPGRQHGELSGTCVVGLKTGLLVAAAVALSPAVSALVPLGKEIVLLAFRTGLHVSTVAGHLDPKPDGKPWAYEVSGLTIEDAQKALSAFHEDRVFEFLYFL